jgi:uncharacterized GH25 family protein
MTRLFQSPAKDFKMKTLLMASLLLGALAVPSLAHDVWVETNTPIIHPGDAVHVDLMLGNHGNNHRDFKLASKADPKHVTLEHVTPDGQRRELNSKLVDVGYEPKEGFWTAPVLAVQPGLHMILATSDHVVAYAPTRSIKSAKTFFLVSKSLDRPSADTEGFDRVLGLPLEIVPQGNPVAPMGPGTPIRVRLLYKGKPLAGAVVSFIPRGATLSEGFDETYERKTDANGEADYEPKSANDYLVVAHVEEPKESGEGYENTKYAATLTVKVPAICACCGE